MFELKVTSHFAAAHHLRDFGGKCEGLHGHNWKVEVAIRAQDTGPSGVVLDFARFKEELNLVLDELDHTDLNRHDHFSRVNPSSEELARYLFGRLRPRVAPAAMWRVTVWESDDAAASYFE
ncbi:MAG: 6-carboxytetrahydropterin synthase [Pseudomonadota bacterium]